MADFIGDAIARSETVTDNEFTSIFADGVRFFLYFVVVTIGLDTIGIDTELLYILAEAAAYGLGAALAIGLGIAIGLGGKEYVSDNVSRWMGSAKQGAKSSAEKHSRPRSSSRSVTSSPASSGTTKTTESSQRQSGTGSGTPTGDD